MVGIYSNSGNFCVINFCVKIFSIVLYRNLTKFIINSIKNFSVLERTNFLNYSSKYCFDMTLLHLHNGRGLGVTTGSSN